jgi:hypothetical protein
MPSDSIRLQINHPFLDPAAMTEALKMEPTRMWRYGQKRVTSKGALIEGKARHSFWEFAAPAEDAKSVAGFLDMLETHKGFLSALPSYAGSVELVLETSTPKKVTDAFSASDLKRLEAMYIEPKVES